MLYFIIYQAFPFALINILAYLALIGLTNLWAFVAAGGARPAALAAYFSVPENRTRVMCNIAVLAMAGYLAARIAA